MRDMRNKEILRQIKSMKDFKTYATSSKERAVHVLKLAGLYQSVICKEPDVDE